MNEHPHLVEPVFKRFLNKTLQSCHEYKNKYYNYFFNIGMFVFLCILLSIILLYKYKGKLSLEELQSKEREKQQYILSKIKNFQDAKRIAHQELITNLPGWHNEYDYVLKK
jgi:hypothetical protein